MHALGVPTTRALSLVGSPLPVIRETSECAAVVCRVAPSFLRFGHFEYYAHNGQPAALARLADHVIDEHHPHLRAAPHRYADWLSEVVARTACLLARWQTLGFCHGVMNTDNFSILGLSLDYGPFGFIDGFRAHHVCNHSDYEGRYAWSAQPEAGRWNCARLLQACLPLLHATPEAAQAQAQTIYAGYATAYDAAVMSRWRAKLGLREAHSSDAGLVNRLLMLMQAGRSDFTRTFRALAQIGTCASVPVRDAGLRFADWPAFDAWADDYRARLRREGTIDDAARAAGMAQVNPLYVLRNHLAQDAIAAAQAGDPGELQRLGAVLARPFTAQPGMERYADEPSPSCQRVEVSCSS